MASKLTAITASSSARKKRKARDISVKVGDNILLQNRPRTRAASKASARPAGRSDTLYAESGAPSLSSCSDESGTNDHEVEAQKCFAKDTAKVTVYAFARRLGEVLHNMCVENEKIKSNGADEGSLEALAASECGEDDLAVLVNNLLIWDDTSRCVGIVALVLMDRIQTGKKGFAITFYNVCKLFTICFLLAKKYLEDDEV